MGCRENVEGDADLNHRRVLLPEERGTSKFPHRDIIDVNTVYNNKGSVCF